MSEQPKKKRGRGQPRKPPTKTIRVRRSDADELDSLAKQLGKSRIATFGLWVVAVKRVVWRR